MRAAVGQATHHAAHRSAFGKLLADQPLMRNVLADLCIESEAATLTAMRLARACDEQEAFKRLGLAVSKYWICKSAVWHVAEALECLGGNGYVELSGMPRLYREVPLNSIWEGSGNVNCLDVLRGMVRSPGSVDAFFDEVDGRIARITLNRPERGNGITLEMPRELSAAVERADLDPDVHVIALDGKGKGFCGGYDLVASAEQRMEGVSDAGAPEGSPLDPLVQLRNHDPARTWDPTIDYAMMSRNVRGFMSLFHANKPVVCKVHGFCVAGGTDMALCSDLLVIAEDARIGYPPARVWGVPTTALWAYRIGPERAKRLLFTGDLLTGREAHEWGLAIEAPPAAELDARFEALLERIALMPVNQLVMMKLLVNQALYAQGLHATQVLGTVFDGVARHTPEGHAFQQRAAEAGWREAVRERDEPFS